MSCLLTPSPKSLFTGPVTFSGPVEPSEHCAFCQLNPPAPSYNTKLYKENRRKLANFQKPCLLFVCQNRWLFAVSLQSREIEDCRQPFGGVSTIPPLFLAHPHGIKTGVYSHQLEGQKTNSG